MKIDIHFKQHSKRKKEKLFFDYLKEMIPSSNHINKNFVFNKELIKNPVNIEQIKRQVENFNKIKENKKEKIINELNKLPKKVIITDNIKQISVDFVINYNGKLVFIEFNEKQHKINSDKRLKPIFDTKMNRLETPRYIQRFLRDIWRYENLKDYKIVWWDWFEKFDRRSNLLDEKRKEYYITGKFSFEKLLEMKKADNKLYS